MKLYGTSTSPFVRRVRAVAAELEEPVERIDTATDSGQVALREISPIHKVPVAAIDGRTLFDSRVIIDWLVTTRGWGGITPPRDIWRERNLLNAIDTSIESLIPILQLRRDDGGVPPAFERRQMERVDAIFTWLASQQLGETFGLPEITLVAALDWMDFRKTYDTARAAGVEHVRQTWRNRPCLAATVPMLSSTR